MQSRRERGSGGRRSGGGGRSRWRDPRSDWPEQRRRPRNQNLKRWRGPSGQCRDAVVESRLASVTIVKALEYNNDSNKSENFEKKTR